MGKALVTAKLNLIGQKYSRLTVISEASELYGTQVMWKCLCECGKITYVARGHLRSGHTRSCGCLNTEVITKHREIFTPEYGVWALMLQRCNNASNPAYHNYGGRGIKVCSNWYDFVNFISDMGKRPTPKHSLDRKDNNKGYEPNNCKWSTKIEQSINKRTNVHINYKGEKLVQSEVAKREGVTSDTIAYRLTKGYLKRWVDEPV